MARALIVDDSPVDRHRVGRLLQQKPGWQVEYAATGEEALAAISGPPPDVVLTDLRMPGMDGLELVQEIKRRHPALPVVLMTAFGGEDIAFLALEQGAASYVPKRDLAGRLHETVEHVLEVAQALRGQRRPLETLTHATSHFVLDNDPALIPPLVGHLRENLLALGLCDENEAIRVGVALREALINAMHHGNLEVVPELGQRDACAFTELVARRRGEPPYRDRRVHLSVEESPLQAVYVIRDEGPGFNAEWLPDLKDPNSLETNSARGLRLIRTFMDEARHNAAGNEITLVKRRRGRTAAPPETAAAVAEPDAARRDTC